MRFYTASKLGSKRSYTKEGFLVCLDVPIARTGEMIYAGPELPELEAGRDGLIRVLRDADAVFDPVAMASFVGMPTTNDHPPEMVNPANFGTYTRGSAQNVRQGQGDQADLLVSDLMFGEAQIIKAIEGGKVEISCGYDAEYEPVSPGVYRQVQITGNHVAVVPEGRCGIRCAIGDSATALQSTQAADAVLASSSAPSCGCGGHTQDAKPAPARKRKTRDMTAKIARPKLRGTMMDKLRRAFSAKDEAGFEEVMNEVESTTEEQEQADLADMIGQTVAAAIGPAISEAIAPIAARLDDVDAYVTDRKTRDKAMKDAEEAAETKRKEDEAKAANDRRMRDGRTRDDGGPDSQAGGAGDPSDRFANGDPGYMGQGMGTDDSPDLAAFLKSKGLAEADVAACLAMIKKDADLPVVATGDEGLTEEEKAAKASGGTKDSASFLAEFRDTIAKAEILSPGVKLPVFDAKAAPKHTTDSLCALRHRALKSAYDSADRKANVAPFLDSATPDFSKMTCDAVKLVFGGASELAKRGNNPVLRVADAGLVSRDSATRTTIDSMNEAAKKLWAGAR